MISYAVVSSTNLTVPSDDSISRSSIIIKKSQGPNLVPCGTPAGTYFHSEKHSLDNLTLCDLLPKKLWIQFTICGFMS